MKLRYAIAPNKLVEDWITPHKKYLINSWNTDGTFTIQDDEGENILCSLRDCHHLFAGNWVIEIITCATKGNVVQYPYEHLETTLDGPLCGTAGAISKKEG